MRPKKVKLPNIYGEKHFKKTGLQIDLSYFWGALVLLLVVFRFINLTTWWFVTHLELTRKFTGRDVKYTSLHFSNYNNAQEKNRELSQKHPTATVTVVSYFNLLHPAVFVIQNKAKFSAVDLGRMTVTVGPGRFIFKIYLADVIEKQWNHNTQRTRFGTSILPFFSTKKASQAGQDVSFILKPLKKSKYLDIPYLMYFYLPLALILFFSFFYTRAVFTSFFYYTGLFLFFDFKDILFAVPFNWLTQLFNIKDTTSFEGVAAGVLVSLFTILGFVGIFKWKEMRDIFKEKLIVLLFILLPIFLRF
jgi:hypothetical protein